MDRITSVTSSSTSVKPRLFDDDPRSPNLRIEGFSARGLDGRGTIDEVGDAGLFAAQYHAREHRIARRSRAPRETQGDVQQSARGIGRGVERIHGDLAFDGAHV